MICLEIFGGNIKGTGYLFLNLKKNDKGEVKDFDFLAIKHDYGVEFVDEINKLQLRRDMELKVINDKRIHHMKDIKNHLILEEKLVLEKN